MADKKKISVILLGNGDSLKKALITNLTGKDLSELTNTPVLKKTEKYENDVYVFTCTPDLRTKCDDIRYLFDINPDPDMSLLVVEDGFSNQDVWQQIEKLHEITKKPPQEFSVVLPFSYREQSDFHSFKCYTINQLFSKLGKLAEERQLTPTNKRHADHRESHMSTLHSSMEDTDGRYGKEQEHSRKNFKKMFAGTTVNLVLLGQSGAGKSASGNTILGGPEFLSKVSAKPVTTECQEADTVIDGTHVHVIDTPDMFDDDMKPSVKDKYVRKCTQLCQPGPCVFLLVIHVSRFTDGERNILKKLKKAFGDRVQEQTVIVFTRGDDLQRAKMSLEDFLFSCQPDLKRIVDQCDGRCVVFENRGSDSHQVKQLMQRVSMVLEKQQEQHMNQTQSTKRGESVFV